MPGFPTQTVRTRTNRGKARRYMKPAAEFVRETVTWGLLLWGARGGGGAEPAGGLLRDAHY